MADAPRIVFLPGAGGSPRFWEPVAARLPASWRRTLLGWPGAGDQPHDPAVSSYEHLIELTESRMAVGSDLVAQSMGGVVAIGVALRNPEKVRRLVLVATSGGIDVAGLGGQDWQASYHAEFPGAAAWVTDHRPDYSAQLGGITAPTLLLWGNHDLVSPAVVGRRLAELIPNSTLKVIPGGGHDLAVARPNETAAAIAEHLAH